MCCMIDSILQSTRPVTNLPWQYWILATLLMDMCIRKPVGSIQQANPNSLRLQVGYPHGWLESEVHTEYMLGLIWLQRFSFDNSLDCVWPTGRQQTLLPTDSTLETAAIMQHIGPCNGCFQRLKKAKEPWRCRETAISGKFLSHDPTGLRTNSVPHPDQQDRLNAKGYMEYRPGGYQPQYSNIRMDGEWHHILSIG